MSQQEREDTPIWGATLDGGKFETRVNPVDPTEEDPLPRGMLVVTLRETGEVLVQEEVPLSFGAIFGPDIADIATWQATTILAVDRWYEEHGETPPDPS